MWGGALVRGAEFRQIHLYGKNFKSTPAHQTEPLRMASPNRTAETIWNDYRQGGRTDKPRFARELQGNPIQGSEPALSKTGLKRHLRHLRG